MKNMLKILWLCVFLIVCGCASKSKYYSRYSNIDNKICPGAEMNFDRQLAAEKRLQIAIHKIKTGFIEKAKENLDCALKYASQSAMVHRVYGYYFEQVGEFDNAEIAYKHAINLAPKDPETLNQYGAFLCERGKTKKAIELFLKAIAIPQYAQVPASYENAGICSLDSGQAQQAESFFRKALGYNPNAIKSLLEMSAIFYNKDQYRMARNYMARFAKLQEHSSRSLWLAMRIEQKLGNKDALGSYGIKLEQMFPDSEETSFYLEKKNQWQR